MCEEYLHGVPVKSLMIKYGYKTKKSISDKVKKYCKTNAIDVARQNRKSYSLNFQQIDNQFNAYFLGLMLTDGYMYQNGKFGIDLTDQDCIEFIAQATGNKYNIYQSELENRKSRYRLIYYNKKVAQKLIEYGVVPNKSLVLKFPKLSETEQKFIPYIIRGVIDGDGCIYKTSYGSPAFFICSASKEFIVGVKQILQNRLFMKNLNLMQNAEGVWRLETAHQSNILILIALVYNKPFGMNRKYKLVREMFRDYNGNNLLG